MKLTQQQIEAFETDGYILLEGLFTPDEAALMKSLRADRHCLDGFNQAVA